MKETVESILIAFILAFIFRAFVVEAFVIPTGSMAPTLLGAHMRFDCTDCGYDFDVNYSSPSSGGGEVNIPAYADGNTYAVHCPNCGLKVPRSLRPDGVMKDVPPGDPENDATAPPVHYGDRILVLKYVYELFEPKRWDVVVFKSPDVQPGEAPFTVNFIKRLIGTPNESVMILDGDIYSRPRGAEQYAVQTKPRVAQDALWRVVYDNDYLPRRPGWTQPWRPVAGSGWDVRAGEQTDARRQFAFANPTGAGWIAFEPDPSSQSENQPLTDWLAYAVTRRQWPSGSPDSFDSDGLVAQNNVSDLKLDLFYERREGDGPLRLELTKLDDTFTAEIYPDRVRLLRAAGDAAPIEVMPPVALAEGRRGPLRVEFTNVDYRVALRINGRDYLATTPQQYAPDLDRLRRAYDRREQLPPARVRIGAEGQACRLSHVGLWRDVYYTNRDAQSMPQFALPDNPVELGADEYFVLGDNALMSGDARYWGRSVNLPGENLTAGPARVPGRFLLGQAFFVYWPAGYRPFRGAPGLVPNFGDMRSIH